MDNSNRGWLKEEVEMGGSGREKRLNLIGREANQE